MKRPPFLDGIRGKLILIFVLIKVVPLLLLAWFAWHAAQSLGNDVSDKAGGMADATLETIQSIGKTVTDDSIRALDLRSREAIEAFAPKRSTNFWRWAISRCWFLKAASCCSLRASFSCRKLS